MEKEIKNLLIEKDVEYAIDSNEPKLIINFSKAYLEPSSYNVTSPIKIKYKGFLKFDRQLNNKYLLKDVYCMLTFLSKDQRKIKTFDNFTCSITNAIKFKNMNIICIDGKNGDWFTSDFIKNMQNRPEKNCFINEYLGEFI